MVLPEKPLSVVQHGALLPPEEARKGKIERVSLSDNRVLCLTQLRDKKRYTLAIDFDDPKRPITTFENSHDGTFNSHSRLVVLIGGKNTLYVCDFDTGIQIETHRMDDEVDLVRWISNNTLVIVTRSVVYHWRVTRNRCLAPDAWFTRDASLKNAKAVDYRTCDDGAWCALIAHEPAKDPHEFIPTEGLAQVYTREHNMSRMVEAHAVDLILSDLTGYHRGLPLAIMAKRTLMMSELEIVEADSELDGKFGSRVITPTYPREAFNDYPVSIHVSYPHAIVFMFTAMGYVHLFDMESGEFLLHHRLTPHRILCTASYNNGAGVLFIDETYQASTVQLKEDVLMPYLCSAGFQNVEVLLRIAERNTHWRLFTKHHLQLFIARPIETKAYMRDTWCAFKSWRPVEDTGRLSSRLVAQDGSIGVTDIEAFTLRGIVLFLVGMLPECIQYAHLALRRDPNDRQARTLLWRAEDVMLWIADGEAAHQRADYTTAIGLYNKALYAIGEKDDTESQGGHIRAEVLAQRAAAYHRLGKHKEAIVDATNSIEVVRDAWAAFQTRGNAYLATRNFERALEDLTRAEQLCPIMEDKLLLQRDISEAQRGIRSQNTPTPALAPGKDYYRILNVRRTASEVEIRQAFRQRSITLHPRKGGNADGYKLLEEAHRVLSVPATRRQYDAMLLSRSASRAE